MSAMDIWNLAEEAKEKKKMKEVVISIEWISLQELVITVGYKNN